MVALDNIPLADGSIAGKAYLVHYDEALWLRLSDVAKEHCRETWIKKALPLDVQYVVLKLTPDPLFPINGNEQPYVAWQHAIERVPPSGFITDTVVTFTLASPLHAIPPAIMDNLNVAKSRLAKGTRWRIFTSENVQVSKGRT